jgi:hypothetical protein
MRVEAEEKERLRLEELARDTSVAAQAAEEERRRQQRQQAELEALRNGETCCHRSWRVENPGPYKRGQPLPYVVCNYCGLTDFQPVEDQRESPEERATRIFNDARCAQRRELHALTEGYLPDSPAYTMYTSYKQGMGQPDQLLL